VTGLYTGLVYGLDELEYHALPGLSSTGAKRILKSPAHYQWETAHRVEKKAYDLGHIVHAFVLGVGLRREVIPGPWNTTLAKERVKAARARGDVPIKPEEEAQAQAMAAAVREHPVAGLLFTGGYPEVSAFWTDETTGVECRGRFDYVRDLHTRSVLVDLKTTTDANPAAFGRTALSLGYDVQTAFYTDGYATITGNVVPFLHVLVEVDPPHAVSVVQLDEDALYVGRLKARRAIEMFRDCTAAGVWPGYSTEIESVSLPGWALTDAERRYL
jgi:hypothetical protein